MGRMCENSVATIIRLHGAVRDGRRLDREKTSFAITSGKNSSGKSRLVGKSVLAKNRGRHGTGRTPKARRKETLACSRLHRRARLEGYVPVRDLDECVTLALKKLDEVNAVSSGSESPTDEKPGVLESVSVPSLWSQLGWLEPGRNTQNARGGCL